MKNIIFLILILGFSSCQSQSKTKTRTTEIIENIDKNGLEIDAKILTEIEQESGKKSEPLNREVWKYDRDGNEESYSLDTGVVFKFINESIAHSIFEKHHDKIQESGNYIFLTNMDFDDAYNSYYDIVIINCSDPYDLIKLIGTDGINYDVYNGDIINQLKKWDTEVGFEFVVIDVSRIHAYMNQLPTNLSKFTKEVYEFCPDVIDQGYPSMKEMVSDYKQNKYFWLWWD